MRKSPLAALASITFALALALSSCGGVFAPSPSSLSQADIDSVHTVLLVEMPPIQAATIRVNGEALDFHGSGGEIRFQTEGPADYEIACEGSSLFAGFMVIGADGLWTVVEENPLSVHIDESTLTVAANFTSPTPTPSPQASPSPSPSP